MDLDLKTNQIIFEIKNKLTKFLRGGERYDNTPHYGALPLRLNRGPMFANAHGHWAPPDWGV